MQKVSSKWGMTTFVSPCPAQTQVVLHSHGEIGGRDGRTQIPIASQKDWAKKISSCCELTAIESAALAKIETK
jgi:hypothetical protein